MFTPPIKAFGSQNLQEILNEILTRFKETHPKVNLKTLSIILEVKSSFLKKIAQPNLFPQANLDYFEVSKFCKYMKQIFAHDDELSPLFAKLHELIHKDFVAPEDVQHEPSQAFRLRYERELYDPNKFLILTLCSHPGGMKRDTLIKIFGASIVPSMEQLLIQNLIIENSSGHLILPVHLQFYLPKKLLGFHLPTLARFYNPLHFGSNRNFVGINIAHVNEAVLFELVEKFRVFNQEVEELLADKQNFGSNPIFLFSCVDSFLNELF